MGRFTTLFGFKKPSVRNQKVDPDDDLFYGCAAYGNLNSDKPEDYSWVYEVGNFDYIWGVYRTMQNNSCMKALALYILNDKYDPIEIINTIAMTPERKLRYGDKCAHGTVFVDLIIEPEDYEGLPSVYFSER